MDHLLRQKAPISDLAWAQIDEEATRSLRHYLAARKVIEYSSEGGWERSSVSIGRVDDEAVSEHGAILQNRVSQSLSEVRVPFTLSRAELNSIDRGANDPDLDPVIEAAQNGARAEDRSIFVGNPDVGVKGISEATPHEVISVAGDMSNLTHAVAKAMNRLQEVGVQGPYAMAAGPDFWARIMETAEGGGYPLIKHLNLLFDSPVVWAPGMERAVVLSQRGGDFEIVGGQDWSIGYTSHDDENVNLYFEESVTFLINTPEAAVVLDIEE